MITIKRCISLLCMGLILFSSCEKSFVPPHLQAIPSSASFVASIESEQLIKKGGLDNLKEYKFFQTLNKVILDQETAMEEFISKLVEDPNASGIDFERFYIYGLKHANGFYSAATFKIGDLAGFEENLTYLLKQNGGVSPDDKGNYKLIGLDKSIALAWNERIFLIFVGDLESVDYGKSFTLSGDESIVNVADFRQSQKQNYDAAFWVSYDQVMDMLEEVANVTRSAYPDEFSSMYVHLYLHCNKGEIKITGEVTPQSKMDEFYAKYPIIKENFNDRLLEDFPETTYWSVKMAINWSEYLKFFSAISGNMYNFQAILESPVVKTVVDGLDGDFLFSLYGFAQGPLPVPLAGISFSVKSEDDFNRILSLVPKEIIQQTGDFYAIGSMGIAIYTAYKDKRVLVTDDADAITAFVGNGYSKNLKNSPLATDLKNKPSLFYLNLDLSTYPGNIRTLLQNEVAYARPFVAFLETCKDFSFGADKDNRFYVSLKFKDDKQNGLKLLIKGLDESFAQ